MDLDKKKETGLIPLEPVSSNNLLKYSLNKSELLIIVPIPCQKQTKRVNNQNYNVLLFDGMYKNPDR